MEAQKFSIVIPCYNKEDTIGRTLQSLISQTYPKNLFEVIVIDDGSTDGSKEVIKSFMKTNHRFIRAFFMKENAGRMTARNLGMRMAQNDWICWLDADDEYMSTYLETYNDEINRNPDYKLLNSGMLIKDREVVDDVRYENGWRIVPPLILNEAEVGMEGFANGQIGTGSFVFHRDIMDFFPENAKTPDGGKDSYPAILVQKDEKFKEICLQNDEGQYLPLGNPWGDDYSYFWYLTRSNKSKSINALLYIQHVRL